VPELPFDEQRDICLLLHFHHGDEGGYALAMRSVAHPVRASHDAFRVFATSGFSGSSSRVLGQQTGGRVSRLMAGPASPAQACVLDKDGTEPAELGSPRRSRQAEQVC
jgi:hypothetical protein